MPRTLSGALRRLFVGSDGVAAQVDLEGIGGDDIVLGAVGVDKAEGVVKDAAVLEPVAPLRLLGEDGPT